MVITVHVGVSRIQGKWEWDEKGKQEQELLMEAPDEGYHVNIHDASLQRCWTLLHSSTKMIKTL